jgi:methionine synthase II (cobalamin-independent)
MVPRVRMDDLWLVDPKELEAKQDEATLLAISDQERVGLDIITDGEQRRESYSNRFATALEGVDTKNPARHSIAAASRSRSHASPARFDENTRSNCAISSSCARTQKDP